MQNFINQVNMRPIKFRIWTNGEATTKEDYSMEYFDLTEVDKYIKIDVQDGDYPVMQFTGLTDKNGKPIFEGDVIWCGEFDRTSGKKLVGEIKSADTNRLRSNSQWYVGGYTLVPVRLADASIANFDREDKWEVIGNVFMNPELLNNDSK